MKRTGATTRGEDIFVLSNLPPSRTQKWLAVAVVLGIFVVYFIVTGPLSSFRPGRLDAFVPAYLTAMFVSDSITAVLLFAQFSILRSRAILVVASAYVYTALILIAYALTFPGSFVPGRGLFGGLQSSAWLYVAWHAGFALLVAGYALSRGADPDKRGWPGTVAVAIALCLAVVAGIVLAAALFCVLGQALLPPIMLNPTRFGPMWPYFVGAPVVFCCAFALVALWIRRRSILDLWLMVVMCLYLVEVPLSYYPDPDRFSVGWYSVRVVAIFSSSLILLVLLHEMTTLYSRLLSAVLAQRREREARLMTGDAVSASIAHEVKQPLSGMITSADAGLRFLNRPAPDLDEAREAFRQIVVAGHRADAVITNIRTAFKKDAGTRTSVDLNDIIQETLALVREDLNRHRVMVEADLHDHLSKVTGDRILLQQVLVNLIMNAIDSMAVVDGTRVLSVRSEILDGRNVGVSIADTGNGIDPQDVDRIFTLFTTKSSGMGMGLLISRSIIESHDGRLWFAPNTPRGAVFQFSFGRPAAG